MEPPGQKPLIVNGVGVGPFEEEQEGTGITSDVLKVEGRNPGTTGCLRYVDTRNNPGTVKIPQYRVNKTKQHTHTHTRRNEKMIPQFLGFITTNKRTKKMSGHKTKQHRDNCQGLLWECRSIRARRFRATLQPHTIRMRS